jgi:Mycoplasma protein of unknown function, DUF285
MTFNGNLSTWDVSNGMDLSGMLSGANKYRSIGVEKWYTNNQSFVVKQLDQVDTSHVSVSYVTLVLTIFAMHWMNYLAIVSIVLKAVVLFDSLTM